MSGKYTRRRFVSHGCLSLAGMVLGSQAACARLTRPTPQQPKITLKVSLDLSSLLSLSTLQQRGRLYGEFLAPFEAAHPSIRLQLVEYITKTQDMEAAIVSGSAADVFSNPGAQYPGFYQSGLLLALDAYMRRDHVDSSIWSPPLIASYQTPQGTTFALPRNLNAFLYLVRLDVLDGMGIPYPSTDWTDIELTTLAGQLTIPQQRVGLSLQPGFLDFPAPLRGFGGSWTNAARTKETLATSAGDQAGEWLFEGLIWPGYASSGSPPSNQQPAVIQEVQTNSLLNLYQAMSVGSQWALYPPPLYPQGRFCNAASAFWAINATTPQPEASWTLLQWLAVDPSFQRNMMKSFLFPPALTSLFSEWTADIEAIAPGMTGKGLRWIEEAASQGWWVLPPYFAYDSVSALYTAFGDVWTQLLQDKVSVPLAFASADQQVDAIVAAGAQAPAVTINSLRSKLEPSG